MKAKEVIHANLENAKKLALGLLADMKDAPLVRSNGAQGNHSYWLLGHLVVSQAALLDKCLLGNSNRHEAWVPKFGIGTHPGESMDGGPTYAQLLGALEDLHQAVLAHLDGLSDDDLDRPCHPLRGPGPRLATVADCLNAMSMHLCLHAGQVADARRAAGRPRLFA